MAELRRDIIRNNWVIIATDQALKADDFPINKNGDYVTNLSFCPFCEGNEAYTTEEIMAVREQGSPPNTAGWKIRLIPNKYSAFKLQGDLNLNRNGIYSNYSGLGTHEVLIETPKHNEEFHQLSIPDMVLIYTLMQQRYDQLARDPRIKYIQIYKNRGLFAGASLEHSHSQIMGLPIIPQNIPGVVEYYRNAGECLICSIINQERETGVRIVNETDHFLLICPYASRFPYESWIIPKRHIEHFSSLNHREIENLARLMKRLLNGLIKALSNPSYNIIINTAPVNVPYEGGYHCYIEITPRLIISAGAEISTGYYVNPAAPEISASLLRSKLDEEIAE
jgi:UDPglucose--hexose-1-phosphate uridylyltransferase